MSNKPFNMNILTFSSLLSRGYEPEEIDAEDIKNMLNGEVSDCQITLYLKIIQMLSEGFSYEEIFSFIDSYTSIEYENLLEDQKTYIKRKARSDLQKRKMSLEKGEI